jgi:phage-related minor tail protein
MLLIKILLNWACIKKFDIHEAFVRCKDITYFRRIKMNTKMILTVAGVAVVALVGFGVMTQDQGDKAESMISNFSNTTEQYVSDVANAVETGMDNVTETAQDLAADAESAADNAYQAAVEEMNAISEDAIEPAAGEAEEMMNDMEDKMSN